MDLFSIISFEAFLLIPFVVYFLFLKKNGGRSLHSGRDFFYPIRIFFARKVVKAAQNKRRKYRKSLLASNVEPEIIFSSPEGSCYQSFSACDQKGNSLRLKFTLKPNKIAEVILVLKLANGSLYSFPGPHKVHVTSIKENKWKINGLLIESLEPYRRLRIVYNGLLQNLSCKSYEKVEHIQFNFIFNCCSSPQFYPEDCDTNIIAETLATKPWKDATWKTFLDDQPDGYEQFGSLFGFVKGECFAEKQILNLPACRSKYEGFDERFFLDRAIRIFLAETNGVLINLTLQSLDENQSQINYGYICHKNQETVPIVYQDLKIRSLGKGRVIPDFFMARISAKSDEYACVFNISNPSTSHPESELGFDAINTYAACTVNSSQGKALVEFQYYSENENIERRIIKPIVSEKIVDRLPDDFVVNIKSNEARILDITGGKGNSLALLSSLGTDKFHIPDGFIITINAFKRQLSENKLLQDAITNIDDTFCGRTFGNNEEVCASAVHLFNNEPVHPEVAKDIIENLKELKKQPANDSIDVVSWAVRSSAIGEDSEELSAAGQNQTILGCVTDIEVLNAVSKCWASLFTYQSVQYRWQHGLPIKSNMAVVVQKMVPAESAGVLFTWHPTSSNPSQMIVTSNFGLGETVVSGKSEPDTFILNRTYDAKVCLLDQVIGTKNTILTLTNNGVKEVTTSEPQEGSFVFVNGKDASGSWSLTKEQVVTLGKIGLYLEEEFGGPRDIEWAFYKGELYLLQSRPITTLHNWTDFELTHELDSAIITENSLFTVANCGEVFPMAVSALTRSFVLVSMDQGMKSYISKRSNRYCLTALCTFQHRVMLDCILTLYFNARTEQIEMSTKVLDLAIFGHPVINEKINSTVRARLGRMPALFELKETHQRWKDSRKVDEILNASVEFVKNLNFEIKDDDSIDSIYEKIVKKESTMVLPGYYHAYTTSVSVFWQMICMMTLVGNKKELSTEHYADFANILSSCEDVESAEVPVYLEKIAKIIKDEGYADEFCTIKPELGEDWLEAKCPEAFKIFEEFLEKHGHRCLGELDLIRDTWGLNPSQVIPMIQANAKHMREAKKEHRTITQVIQNLYTPTNAITRAILKYALSRLRIAVGKREQSKSALTLAVHKSRLAYRRLAVEMVREGLLPSENLIYHLTLHELGEVVKRRNPLLVTKATKRQKLYWKWNDLKFPELIHGVPEPMKEFHTPLDILPGTICTGTPVCTGVVQARACVITHLDEVSQLQKGDILITYSTDIGWSPYFPMLGGVVTELGGLVSHGAVVAREYGLPCIVGVKNVTKMFKTGDIVHLSGKTGELGKV